MSIITATNYAGRLHIGYGDENSVSKCLGNSLYVYHSPIAKFFTKLFGFSIEIDIANKSRCISKKSFTEHLQSIGLKNSNINEVCKIGYRTFIQNHAKEIIVSNEKLAENFSTKKRIKSFNKMISQLEANNTEAVKRLISKGAYIDKEFYKPCDGALSGQSSWDSRSDLEGTLQKYYLNTKFCCYTPLALAAEKGNQSLAKFILNAKNNDVSSDKKQIFNYSVTSKNYSGTYWKTEIATIEQVVVNKDSSEISLDPPKKI